MALEEIEADEMASSAVIRKFEVIGEAVKHIPLDLYIPLPKKRFSAESMRKEDLNSDGWRELRVIWFDILKRNVRKVVPSYTYFIVAVGNVE